MAHLCPKIGCSFQSENPGAVEAHFDSKHLGIPAGGQPTPKLQRFNSSAHGHGSHHHLTCPSPSHPYAAGRASRSTSPAAAAPANHVSPGSAFYGFSCSFTGNDASYAPTPAQVLESCYGPPDDKPRSSRFDGLVTQQPSYLPIAQGRGAQRPYKTVPHREESRTLANDILAVGTGARPYDERSMMANGVQLTQVYEDVGLLDRKDQLYMV